MVLARHLQLASAIREVLRGLRKVLISKSSNFKSKSALSAVKVRKVLVPVVPWGVVALNVPYKYKALLVYKELKSCLKC